MSNEILKVSLDPACVKLELKSRNRNDAIKELLDLIHAKHHLRHFQDVLAAVMERENKMTTSLENGIAVPHGKTSFVDSVHVAVGLKRAGIDFYSADGELSSIIILILSPLNSSGPHVKCLAEIARLLHSPANRGKLLAAKDTESIYRIITDSE